ncbi:hypothetical protein EVA_18417 [gut metagenome]|uniref:Uncharacterized protein n=1 Tax=gut metagenome TaxID=749906 RepID=J9FEZ0_9ZZZZ
MGEPRHKQHLGLCSARQRSALGQLSHCSSLALPPPLGPIFVYWKCRRPESGISHYAGGGSILYR